MMWALIILVALSFVFPQTVHAVDDGSPLIEKAKYFEKDLHDKHWLDGLYVSITNAAPDGTKLSHTVNEPGNVIHSGVWTGRYLGGVGYQYSVTKDPEVRKHGGQILKALRILQEVTGKPGLLCRGYVQGHGPVEDWERYGADSLEWHQGQGAYADYRFYSDVSVDNFNAALYGYAIYYDLAADEEQKAYIAHDVDRLMTHLLDNHCRIIDLDGEPTLYGHVGIDPDPAREEYYNKLYANRARRFPFPGADKLPLRSSLMLLPDLLIADHITGKPRYREMYRKVVEKFRANPEPDFFRQPISQERLARLDHSSEGQNYEALYNLIRYEKDPELLKVYRGWVGPLWEANWSEGNAVFAYMTMALLPEYRDASRHAQNAADSGVPYAAEGLKLARQSMIEFPISRKLSPVMNSLRKDIELNPFTVKEGRPQAAKPLPMKDRPHDNEYVWKGNPYQLDGWLKSTVTSIAFSADDPQVAWFTDSGGRLYRTLDGGKSWSNAATAAMGATFQNIVASKSRTFVLWAQTSNGLLITRDGGLSWRPAPAEGVPEFVKPDFHQWLAVDKDSYRITEEEELVRSTDDGKTSQPAMQGWRIPKAKSVFNTQWGVIASGPGGVYSTRDGQNWKEVSFFREQETGAADFLHAYWMGRYYGFLPAE